jgi:ADP-ribose pyrophosphatase YjhB (NUDIX family)
MQPSPRAYPASPVVGVGAVVILADGAVVLVRRASEPLAGRWTLPGGRIEIGETARAAAAREVREETGLVVDVGAIVDVVDYVDVDASGRARYHYVIVDFLCRFVSGDLRAGDDADEVAAAAADRLAVFDLTDATHAVIGRALEMYTAGRSSS